jgi:putative tryptophan/tyrosine transport system substrate-binding protein
VITRRSVSLAGGMGLLLAHPLVRGQPAARMRRVGWLGVSAMATSGYVIEAFKQGMRDLGWLEGSNIEYSFVWAGGDMARLDGLALELVNQQVDVILVSNPPGARAAQRATKTIPIVMVNVSNAVGNGLVASLARPGGNITGITAQQEEVLGKLIGILHEVTPRARRIAILLNEATASHAAYWTASQSACAALGLVALRVVANAPSQLGTAVEQIVSQRSEAVVVVQDGMYFAERARLQELMETTRLPVAYGFREHVVAGGLLSYSSDLLANYLYAIKFVDKILKGAKPADLPVEQPTRFRLVVNLSTARALGLTIPRTVLLRADEVIE